jgi:hypothetical protein
LLQVFEQSLVLRQTVAKFVLEVVDPALERVELGKAAVPGVGGAGVDLMKQCRPKFTGKKF